ncbi:hypothetical protein [Amycolatopsis magusensis]|uniref:hypothetical protein n=1 Tax=Amycolatopsis magusensis TaxID=882444 RepID=UPI003C30A003
MPSSEAPARPPEWPAERRGKPVATLVGVILLSLVCIPVAFGFVAIGKPSAVKYVVLFGAVLLLTAAYAYETQLRRRDAQAEVARDGVELRYTRAGFLVLVGLMVCMTAIFAFAALDYFTSDNPVPAVLCAIAAVFCGSFPALVVAGRVRAGRIRFTAAGIHQRGRAFSSFLPWESVAGAKAGWNGKPEVLIVAYANAPWERRQHSRLWKLDKLPPVPMIEIDCTVLECAPEYAHRLVLSYVNDPATRRELP